MNVPGPGGARPGPHRGSAVPAVVGAVFARTGVAGIAYLATILLSLAYAGFIAIVLIGFYRRLVAEASET
jgi:hypothetical protein